MWSHYLPLLSLSTIKFLFHWGIQKLQKCCYHCCSLQGRSNSRRGGDGRRCKLFSRKAMRGFPGTRGFGHFNYLIGECRHSDWIAGQQKTRIQLSTRYTYIYIYICIYQGFLSEGCISFFYKFYGWGFWKFAVLYVINYEIKKGKTISLID